MKEVPNKLHCSYCVRNHRHGGECSGKEIHTDEKGCLVFKPDPMGCIRSDEGKIAFPLYHDIPLLNMWQDGWTYNEVSTRIRITMIKGLSWNIKKGCLYIHGRFDYFVNEYHEDYKEPKDKTHLKLIK